MEQIDPLIDNLRQGPWLYFILTYVWSWIFWIPAVLIGKDVLSFPYFLLLGLAKNSIISWISFSSSSVKSSRSSFCFFSKSILSNISFESYGSQKHLRLVKYLLNSRAASRYTNLLKKSR